MESRVDSPGEVAGLARAAHYTNEITEGLKGIVRHSVRRMGHRDPMALAISQPPQFQFCRYSFSPPSKAIHSQSTRGRWVRQVVPRHVTPPPLVPT